MTISTQDFQKILNDNDLEEISAKKIIDSIGRFDIEKGNNIVEKLKKSINLINKYTDVGGSLFESVTCPDSLLLLTDHYFAPLLEKYKSAGLDVPCTSYEQVKKWLRNESLNGVLSLPRLSDPLIKNKELWEADIGLFEATRIYLNYEKTKNGYNSVNCNNSCFLLELKYLIDRITAYTGFDSIDLLKYFFCGTKPKLKRYILTQNTGVNAIYKIQINTTDVTQNEFISFFKAYQGHVNIKYKKKMSEKMKAFAIFMENRALPEGNTSERSYYTELMNEWNQMYPEWHVGTPQAMRKKHISLKEKNCEMTPFLKNLIINKSEVD